MTDLFSANASTLGYFYQARQALLLLLRAGRDNQLIDLTLECLDDVAFEDKGEPIELIQTKHHISSTAKLTNSSSDLWKTLRVWSHQVLSGQIRLEDIVLTLITTAHAPDNSAASKLRPERSEKDLEEALTTLQEVAATGKSNPSAYEEFSRLGGDKQRQLLMRIRVLDGSPNIIDVENLLLQDIDPYVRPRHKLPYFERLEGWWMKQVIDLLSDDPLSKIPYAFLQAKLNDLRDQFVEDNLPADFLTPLEMDEEELDPDQRIFVEQLRLVAINEPRIRQAISDYYRAYQQRSKWVRDGLIFDSDLEVYEVKLIDEWKRYYNFMKNELGAEEEEEFLQKEGRKLFHHIDTQVEKPIKPKFREEYVTRGSFHILANGMRIGWHRDFIEKLQHLVSIASEEES